jgi:uncharacterized cupredoxin-like copper-binding protein
MTVLACTSDDDDDAGVGGTATDTPVGTATATPTETSTTVATPAAPDDDGDAALESAAHLAMVLAAVDAADTAGFHGMGEEIETAGEVTNRQIRAVNNVLTTMTLPEWNEELEHGAFEMIEALQELKAAMESGDVELVTAAVAFVHEAQHHFSPEVYEWVAAQELQTDADAAILVTGLAAVDIVDAAGFHGIAEDLAKATEVNTRLAGRVRNVQAAVEAAVWPADLQANVDAFVAALESLHEATETEDLDAARTAADEVHDVQHGFSGGWYDWLAANHASIDHSNPLVARAAGIKVINAIDGFGLHGIATELENATEVSPRLARNVENLIAVMNGDHFGPAADSGEQLRADLQALQEALAAEDLGAAHEAADAAHEVQHDLSHDMYAWFADAAMVANGHDDHAHGEAETTAYLEEAPKDRTIRLEMSDFAYTPDVIEIGTGEVVEIEVENTTGTPHDFTVDAIDADVHVSYVPGSGEHVHIEGMEEADLHFALTEAGEGLIHVMVHEPGTYQFYCTVPGHRELGMEGTLVVQ